MELDVVIFGGGAAGLWLLDELTRRGARALLLEAGRLGEGQTVGSQGILHGGLKYMLQGLLTRSAMQVREMPGLWRDCLAGRRSPDLSGVRVRSQVCHLWRTDSVASRLGMIGAKFGLRVAPSAVSPSDCPPVLAGCPGTVARLDEQVISPQSFLANLSSRHRDRLLQIEPTCGVTFTFDGPGQVRSIILANPDGTPSPPLQRGRTPSPPLDKGGPGGVGMPLDSVSPPPPRPYQGGENLRRLRLVPRYVVFAAGGGNAGLRRQVGLPATVMQRRPLHMVLVRGALPVLNGHCIDGAKTRVTITSDVDSAGRTVWQVGGQIAEEGVGLDQQALIARTRAELLDVLPGLDLCGAEWSTYRIDRAEGATPGGRRPDTVQVFRDGNVLTAWPTKLVLVPRLATELADALGPFEPCDAPVLSAWPRPQVALSPWDTCDRWYPAGPNLESRAA